MILKYASVDVAAIAWAAGAAEYKRLYEQEQHEKRVILEAALQLARESNAQAVGRRDET